MPPTVGQDRMGSVTRALGSYDVQVIARRLAPLCQKRRQKKRSVLGVWAVALPKNRPSRLSR